jgi:hypothetical protein
MKKSFSILIVVLAPLFVMAGCSHRLPSFEDRVVENGRETIMVENARSFEGVIEPLTIDIHQGGTHRLVTTEREVLLIQSSTINLNRYLEGNVMVTGYLKDPIGDAEPVFNVTGIERDLEGMKGDLVLYDHPTAGFQFEYLNVWEPIDAGNKILLDVQGLTVVIIETFTAEDWQHFVTLREGVIGTPVTVGAQKSWRYTDDHFIRFYIPNPSKDKVYHVRFNARDHPEEEERFYDLIKSFQPLYFQKATGERCGGAANLQCEEGFRCELQSNEPAAPGACVSINESGSDSPCPFIAFPIDCTNYHVGHFGQNGCPARYVCGDQEKDPAVDSAQGKSEDSKVANAIKKYQDKLLGKNVTVLDYEVMKEEGLVAVTFKAADKNYKTLFSYSPSGTEFNFIEKERFEKNEGDEWMSIDEESR